MKKFLTLVATAATLLGTTAPLTATHAAPASLPIPVCRTYAQGYDAGQQRMSSCSITNEPDWQAARDQAKLRSDRAYAAGNMCEYDYWTGYYDGLGATFQPYC